MDTKGHVTSVQQPDQHQDQDQDLFLTKLTILDSSSADSATLSRSLLSTTKIRP